VEEAALHTHPNRADQSLHRSGQKAIQFHQGTAWMVVQDTHQEVEDLHHLPLTVADHHLLHQEVEDHLPLTVADHHLLQAALLAALQAAPQAAPQDHHLAEDSSLF
jgi:hypothetical protein